ncbi:ABC transporter permease [Calidifontibacillus erzurumensis]|uniref:ABC transporter permease n=1 Tax=Calidifontibacillus erzurumensis TaxID=2741433 RepID=A0A8J8GH98_9BACI|nr:ABC transporter permease [Calidifontibacillus erzurumensis]NSL53352.1 ABC transporter permease [Calidifontibacillus erzurumensis]
MTLLQFAFNNVKRNTRVYLAYFLSSVFTIMIFFSFAVNLFHPEIENKSGGAIEIIMGQAEAVILIFSFLFVFISVNSFLKIRSKEFGILMILGMTKKQLRRLVFLENMMIGCLAIMAGITIGLVFSKLLLMILSNILSYGSLSFYFPFKAIIVTVAFFILIFIGISTLTPLIIRTSTIIILLKGTKKPNREIKFSFTQSILAVLLLGSGYFIALSPKAFDIHPLLDKVVLFIESIPYLEVILTASVVIGTYLFFSQLSIFVLHWLKRNRRFYMKKTNMLWVSDLIYRIRDNSRMLFLVTILSSVAFTSITGVYALSSVVKDESLKDHPFALTYTSYSNNGNELQHIKIIDEMLKSYGFQYEKVKSEVIKQASSNNHTIHIIKLSDYNDRVSALGLEKVDLKKDEALLIPVYVRFDPKRDKTLSQETVSLNKGEINLEVVGVAPKVIFYSGLFNNLIAVHDEIFNQLTNIQDKYYSYSYVIPDWQNTLEVTENLREELGVGERGLYFWSTRIEGYILENQNKKLFLYVGFFLGAIFFLGASSFLYFRLYTDLNQEKNKYIGLSKIGLSFKEMKKVASMQIAILFFVPFILACIHTFFAIMVLQTVLYSSVFKQFLIVIGAFLILNIIYYLSIRYRYINLLNRLIDHKN